MGEVGEVIPEKQHNEVEGKIAEDEEITTTVLESVSQNGEVTNGIHKDDDEDRQEIEDDEVEMEEEDDEEEDKNNNEDDGQEIEDEEMSQSYDESTKNTEDEVSNGVNGNPMETDDSQSQPAQDKIEDVEVIPSDDEDEGSQDPLSTKQSHGTMEVDSGETVVEKIVESVELSDDEDKPAEPPIPEKQRPEPPAKSTATNNVADDDDDDDCVVIDDDDDDEPQMVIDTQKKVRSFASMDEGGETPPSKRQRTTGIQIKDARSLISSPSTTITPVSSKTPLTPTSVTNNTPSVHIYPVGLRASSNTTSPPKLVPVSNTNSSTPTSGNVKDLLPGLTDDMFVLEAPSFIVPYIYEKPPENPLITVVKKLEEKFDLNNLQDEEKENQLDEDVEKAINEASKSVANQEVAEGDRKKRRGKNGDDSWSEGSDVDEHEEDEDSDSMERTKVLIKDAGNELAVLKNAIKPATTTSPKTNTVANGTQKAADKTGDNFFESPLGKFFTDLGIGFVQEFVQSDLLKIQKRKLRKTQHSGEASVIEKAVNALKENLHTSRKHNSPFRFDMKRCEYCSFKSESALSLALHYQSPHMNGVMYRCNFCPFEIRSSHEIIQHMDYVHNVKARIEKNPSYHACPNCPYEENGKAKLARHAIVCAKKFRPEVNLAPPQDWEAPAKIPRVKPRHGLVGTATAYQAMAAQAAAQKAVLETMQLQQQQRSMNMQNSKSRTKNKTSNGGINKANAALRNVPGLLPNNFQIQGGQLVQVANTGFSVLTNTHSSITLQAAQSSKRHNTGSQQPSISITPLPRHSNSPSASTSNSSCTNLKMLPAGLKPGQSPAAGAKFVICEICDGYIKDLEQLRNHMQWMHKVKIHPKMIYNRPPLNCQKCQFRFFTDQGLERHLLGSHGLVTSSMQEAANKGKDSGRCPVCGRMYQWKLLNHVSRDHHMTLKPAHLSYKCTVCTATFGMYKQFETHVYTAHSTVAKKQLDGKKNSSSSGSSSTRNSSSTNDNLLKPLKINDEITIIPQPSSKATRTIDID